jgi:deazaflavin-dependent oxidoreductase (nitroreductase family)
MTGQVDRAGSVPLQVRLFSPVLKFLLVAGLPLGYNGLITVRGRKTGLPRTAAVAILPAEGKRYVWAPWGDVHWVRNLRAAGHAKITVRRQQVDVTATELDRDQRVAFFRDTLAPFARRIPLGVAFVRFVDGVDLNLPQEAADCRRVFELHPVTKGPPA